MIPKNGLFSIKKYRDGEIDIDTSLLEWDVDKGHIEEVGNKFFGSTEY